MSEVVDSFKKIEEKSKNTFTNFDIKYFYLSISKYLLQKALEFAKKKISVVQEEETKIDHTRKSLLFKDQETAEKRGQLFDMTVGAYNRAEICELVRLFIIYKFQQLNKVNNFGLDRDDGLAAVKNMSGPQWEKVKKELQVLFKEFGLNLIIECNKATVDYQDITLNLLDGTYKPYQEPENTLQCIHKESNYPPNIIKQIPTTIETRLSNHSSNETVSRHVAQYSVKAHKNQVIMLSYSTNQQIRIEAPK